MPTEKDTPEDWLLNPADLPAVENGQAAGSAYYRRAIGGNETPQVVHEPTKLSIHKATTLQALATRASANWEAQGTLAEARAAFEAEAAFTLFCMRNNKRHPSGDENLGARLDMLQWITAYLR